VSLADQASIAQERGATWSGNERAPLPQVRSVYTDTVGRFVRKDGSMLVKSSQEAAASRRRQAAAPASATPLPPGENRSRPALPVLSNRSWMPAIRVMKKAGEGGISYV